MKKTSWLLLIALCLMMVMTAPSAQAADETKQVTIFFNNIKLLIDGKATAIKNDEGKTVEPFILDGVVYVPARTLGDLLKTTYQYNKKYTSYFVGKPTTKPVKWVSLYEKPYVSTSNASDFKSYVKDGIQYLGGAVSTFTELPGDRHQGSWDITYALNGVAQKVSGTICMNTNTSNAREAIFEFFGDNDELLYRSPIMTHNVAEEHFEFDTGKALKLKLKITVTSNWYYGGSEYYVKDLMVYSTDY